MDLRLYRAIIRLDWQICIKKPSECLQIPYKTHPTPLCERGILTRPSSPRKENGKKEEKSI
ncbi:predicted protein [Sclerotinia sclerotiorum 1980 UF-70]|uniref:Uncharacterized protein n=1 Tax=Sclerotinia sclerotiorum (strain ATCC 18683 / 1980 / Ss-1) TaxID=665079 RepID=A7E6C7_SCLS1|nr:predicted protein [Sclerotinia sclerotiorum 1980 UF-70]EDN91449.1 predicted protein [Sclerotinia sclerotiorum 1980 UF-70]